ncbi:MAG: hypothetical protein V8Q54_01995 [Alistipes senegalensis]
MLDAIQAQEDKTQEKEEYRVVVRGRKMKNVNDYAFCFAILPLVALETPSVPMIGYYVWRACSSAGPRSGFQRRGVVRAPKPRATTCATCRSRCVRRLSRCS